MFYKMKELLFGTAGVPISCPERGSEAGIKQVRKLNLSAMELEFVYGVRMSEETAKTVGNVAREENVVLTAHAPYFINLNAKEKEKIEASKKRIYDTARIANLAGAYSICFHPGFYLGEDSLKVYDKIKNQLKDVVKKIQDEGIELWVRPETTGKGSQFGTLNEILALSEDIEQVMPCIDFAHLHARTQKINSYDEFREILTQVENYLGKTGLENMHIHMSGIEYSVKGERKHLVLDNSDFDYKNLMKVFKEFNIKGVVISEGPNVENDALLMKRVYGAL